MRPLVRHQGRVRLFEGDSRVVLKGLPDNSLDSCSCDPPYALDSVVKRFGKTDAKPAQYGKDGAFARASAGFMGMQWDTGETAFDPEFWREVYRVLKPGAYLAAFGGTRTYHWLAMGIELAGFEIRDQLAWTYGTGFPKNHPQAKGQGSALKPAWEPICLAQKPFKGSIAGCITEHGTGGLQIEASRIPMDDGDATYIMERIGGFNNTRSIGGNGALHGGQVMDRTESYDPTKGRFPANLIHDGSWEVLEGFPVSAGQRGAVGGQVPTSNGIYGEQSIRKNAEPRGDNGSAARFFYCAKASKADREEGCEHLPLLEGKTRRNHHPTVKPTSVVEWVTRLITPPGGVVLDPFMGSGSTGKACMNLGLEFVGIDAEPAYLPIAEARIAHAARKVLPPAADYEPLDMDGY